MSEIRLILTNTDGQKYYVTPMNHMDSVLAFRIPEGCHVECEQWRHGEWRALEPVRRRTTTNQVQWKSGGGS